MLRKEDLRLPRGTEFVLAADTGTYMSGSITAVLPDGELLVVEVFPNYRYVAGEIELVGITVGEWFKWFGTSARWWTKKPKNIAWCDRNTAFTTEVSHGVTLRRNFRHLTVRTECTREYFKHRRIALAPWLNPVLAYEIENAKFPEDSTNAGTFERIKKKDHTLDTIEHTCSRHPLAKQFLDDEKAPNLRETLYDRYRIRTPIVGARDPHLGSL